MTDPLGPNRLRAIGDIEIFQVPEITIPTSPRWLLSGADPGIIDAAKSALDPVFFGDDGRLIQSVHTYVVKAAGKIVLIDTGVGNQKSRAGGIPVFDMLDTPFLARLASAGVTPDLVDLVLCTHMHVDHLGWDTQRVDGEWIPTFPNARHIFVRPEYDAFRSSIDADASARLIWDDTIEPLDRAGLIDLVEADARISETIRLEPSHGHSPGHVNVVVESAGDTAVFTGDAMHSPIQVLAPDVASPLNGGPDATQARLDILRRYADTNAVIFGAHFSYPCGGHVRSVPAGFTFDPVHPG